MDQACLMLKEPVSAALAGGGMNLHIALGGFAKSEKGAQPLRADARLFLSPKPPGDFIEPYVMSDALILLVEYREGQDVHVALFAKSHEHDGFGRELWSGTMPQDAFPASIDVWLNAQDYRVKAGKNFSTIGGSLSGAHGLPEKEWSGPLWFGIKGTWGNQPCNDVIREVRLTPLG